MKLGFVLFIGSLLLVSGCEKKEDSVKVKACVMSCEQSPVLQKLNPKVMYKPIKLCKKKCEQTGGTCLVEGSQVVNLSKCIFFGVNAGREPGAKGHLIQ